MRYPEVSIDPLNVVDEITSAEKALNFEHFLKAAPEEVQDRTLDLLTTVPSDSITNPIAYSTLTRQTAEEFTKDSAKKDFVFRALGKQFGGDFDLAYAIPRELGVHYGSRGAALNVAKRIYNDPSEGPYNAFPLVDEIDAEDFFSDADNIVSRVDETGESTGASMVRGYIDVKYPLVLEE